jgi:two-component SAPR family response regulator
MTKEELLAKIKAEIERRKGICTAQIKANPEQTFPFVMEITEYDKILSFLSTLESEKPIEQDGLEEEIESYWKENGPMSHAEYDRLAKCANHFAQWGAEHLKK